MKNWVAAAILLAALLLVAEADRKKCPHYRYGACKHPQVYSYDTCSCVYPDHAPHRPSCGPHQQYNPRTYKCECPHRPHCDQYHNYNPNTCKCERLYRPYPREKDSCASARTAAECYKTTCKEPKLQGKQCVYLKHSRECVCPCCVAHKDKQFSFWCLARSPFKKYACDPTFCYYVC